MTLRERLAEARARLVAAGIAQTEASVDVDVYVRTILGWDRTRLLAEQSRPIPAELEPTFSNWITRREHHEPTAYIVGVREFWGLDFLVTPAVLIPRPETEFIVEEALSILSSGDLKVSGYRTSENHRTSENLRIADIGTGSGCVAVTLAHERPGCRIVASDVSAAALDIARANAIRHGVADRIEFVVTSYLHGIPGMFDAITANPPYVKDGDKAALSPDVRHEPDVALFGGTAGLRDIGGVLEAAVATLMPGGWLFMEFGFGQEDDVTAMVAMRPALRLRRVRSDLQGIPRTAIIQRE
ncbi:MAG: peptide chain release factor N(5)-glutamine methyltransferase [Vicinamibacterales bacterium]